jgi:cytochrome c oxidase subunit IV
MSSHHPETHAETPGHDSRHPTFKQYVAIAIILFVITAVEFLIIVPEQLEGSSIVVAPLIILSLIKFAIVIMFYMHLKFDSKLYTWMFLGGMALALSVGVALLGLFGSFQPTPREYAQAHASPFDHDVPPPGPPPAVDTPNGVVPPPPVTPPTEPGEPDIDPDLDTALVAQGREIFTGTGGCAACHAIEGISTGMVGPDLTHIGTDAADRKPGMSAHDYIEESIVDPEAFISDVPRAMPGIMTRALVDHLTDEEVEALVEFLMAQR